MHYHSIGLLLDIFASLVKTRTISRASTINYRNASSKILEIICYKPVVTPEIFKIWMSSCFKLRCKGHYVLHFGENASMTYNNFKEPRLSLNRFLYSGSRGYCIHSFEESCWAVETDSPFSVTLELEAVSLKLAAMSIVGIVIFFLARSISESSVFQYCMGTILGSLLFTIIVGLIFAKMLTNKVQFFFLTLAGTGTFAYFLGWVTNNLSFVIGSHLRYVLIYIGVTSLISFSICYIHGPILNPRALHVLQWLLQGLSLTLVYQSVAYEPYGMTLCAVAFLSGLIDFLCDNRE